MDNIITIGNQKESKISAFGDDSKFNKTNAFAYVIFENTNLEIARRSLFDLKDKYRIPNNVLIHMRQLANEHQRKKNNIQHLTEGKIIELLSDMIDEMNKIPFLIKGSYFSGNLPKNIVDDEGFDETWSDKGVQSMLAKFALIPLDLEKYQYEDLKIVIARDQTITKFLGKNKRQADRWVHGFSDIGASDGFVYEINPIIQKQSEEILLQLADVVVYMLAHAFDNEKKSSTYKEILDRVRNIDVHPMIFTSG